MRAAAPLLRAPEPLNAAHDCSAFSNGVHPALDAWLRHQGAQPLFDLVEVATSMAARCGTGSIHIDGFGIGKRGACRIACCYNQRGCARGAIGVGEAVESGIYIG